MLKNSVCREFGAADLRTWELSRMDLPPSSAGLQGLTPVEQECPAATVSRPFGSRVKNGHPGSLWLESSEQRGIDAIAQSPILSEDGPTSALQVGYGRYLRSLSWAEADVLNTAEILELLLYFGRSGHSAASLAAQLLERFASLGGVLAADPGRLAEVLGDDRVSITLLKTIRAAVKAIVREPLEDRPVISSASTLMDYLSVTMRHEPTETMRILFLDSKNALIKDEIQQRGTVDHAPLYTREVVKRVVELGACAVILVHNHPSGDPAPSQADVKMTRELAAALDTIKVVLHDHVIVGHNRESSLRKLKLI
jgi:DNA repair protein RadC